MVQTSKSVSVEGEHSTQSEIQNKPEANEYSVHHGHSAKRNHRWLSSDDFLLFHHHLISPDCNILKLALEFRYWYFRGYVSDDFYRM